MLAPERATPPPLRAPVAVGPLLGSSTRSRPTGTRQVGPASERAKVWVVKAQKADPGGVVADDFVGAVRDVSRVLLSYLVKQAHVSKLGLVEYSVLVRACDEDGVTARDAARAFDLNTSTMTGISDRLEQEDLVRRRPHPTDRRVLVLKATRRGRQAVMRTIGPFLADLDEFASGLDAEERERLTAAVRWISERMEQEL